MIVAIGAVVKAGVAPSTYPVATVGFNYTEKPIYWFGVITAEGQCGNDAGGKRPGTVYLLGNGITHGCMVRSGETATVKWEFDQPYSDVLKKVPMESHQVTVTIPQPETRDSGYLQVHFLSGNRVVLDWRDNFADSRVDPVSGKIIDLHDAYIDPDTGRPTPFKH
ncbi:DUF3304 domain-containing protein [Dyella japonica]|uniref:DUF3304 domain-containing protein n=1 Tax=Dyella japonica TaxID=231455 RepID=A0ABV2K0U4_9GAMM